MQEESVGFGCRDGLTAAGMLFVPSGMMVQWARRARSAGSLDA